jgi:hypothetical protein
MSTPQGKEPDWENSDQWTEFEWEQGLKHSDHVAGRYFRLLERFGDLPDAETFIAGSLGEQNFFEFQDEPYYLDQDDEDWQDDDDEPGDTENDASERIGPGDSLYFETCPVYQRARQISLGWCNILASVLKPDDRMWGLGILFHLGRLLSYLSLCIGDGTFERLAASIAFAKRGLQEINLILGEIDTKTTAAPRYRSIFKLIRDHLLETHDMLVTLRFDLAKRTSDPSQFLDDDDDDDDDDPDDPPGGPRDDPPPPDRPS